MHVALQLIGCVMFVVIIASCVILISFFLLTGRNANYIFKNDKEVICTTEFSESTRLKYGEAKFAMLNQRPIETLTPDLINFTLARFIRVRLEGMKVK